VVDHLLNNPQPAPRAQLASPAYELALEQYTAQRTVIEADILESLSGLDVPIRYLKNANHNLGDNIQAALSLGDINLLNNDLEWVNGLLINFHYRMPAEIMKPYMDAYRQAAERHLDARGKLLLDWFEGVN